MTAPFPSPTATWRTETYSAISPTRSELSAQGKTVVITGGGTGIGAETARYFAMAGASRIAIFGRREQPLLDTKASIEKEFTGVEVYTASTDVTVKSSVDEAFAGFLGDKKLDVLVSNAAMCGPFESVKDVDGDKFMDCIQQNVSGSLNAAQAFLKYAAEGAVVIDVNSSAAHINFGPVLSAYCVAKLAVFRLWDTVAFANPGISVFHIQPGVIDTAMNKEAGGVEAIGFSDDGEFLNTGRLAFDFTTLTLGLVSLPASFSVWLASPEARFLRGKFIWANWDVDELKAQAERIVNGTLLSVGLDGWPFGQGAGWKLNSAWDNA